MNEQREGMDVVRILDSQVVPDSVTDDAADMRRCVACGRKVFHTPQRVMVLSASGARSMRLWTCEVHRLPDMITDVP